MDAPRNIRKNVQFFNTWARSYDHSLVQFWMRKFQRPVFSHLSRTSGIKILDIGCGTGEFLKTLQKKSSGEIHLYGIDLSPKMLSIACKKLPSSVKLQQADVHHLPFPDNSFDYVLCMESFHHYHDQQKALSEMARVVKKQGKIIIVDINFFSRGFHWLFQKLEPGCVHINTKRQLRTLFRKESLDVSEQKRYFLFSIFTEGIKR